MTAKELNEYVSLIRELKDRYSRSRLKASCLVNIELMMFYWGLGKDIVKMEQGHVKGYTSLAKLSADLEKMMPEAKCFSR